VRIFSQRKEVNINIFALMIFLLFIGSGFVGAELLSRYHGCLGWIAGFIFGCSVFALVYSLIMHYWRKWCPIHPPCKKGKCTGDDYELVERNREEGTVVFCCKCGTKYFQKLPYFKEILPDGSMIPYMKENKWGRWKPDEDSKNSKGQNKIS
jgi:hypothetical protein